MQEMEFVLSPDLQVWMDKHIIARTLAAGMKTVATVKSADFIAALSMELALDENAGLQKNKGIFASEEEALIWMNGK